MLFEPHQLAGLQLANKVVMAPMTRSRALGNVPNAMMAEYYAQRASAGLIITEGVSPSPNGLGYARIPGLFNEEHVKGWRLVTQAVHHQGGKLFVQLMHTGRVSHVDNLPSGAQVLSPSQAVCPGEMWTDQSMSMHPHSTPKAMDEAQISSVIQEYVQSARLAIEAGFDGIELHAANGYLLEQFLNPLINDRSDGYGGSAHARNRLVLEIAKACVQAIGAEHVGMRISPYGVFNGTGPYEGMEEQYVSLTQGLSQLGLVYLHVVDHSAMGAPPVPHAFKQTLRQHFAQSFIVVGGFDAQTAENVLLAKEADLVAFGRPFISNPDLVARLKSGATLAAPDMSTFYTPGEKGYTDYAAI